MSRAFEVIDSLTKGIAALEFIRDENADYIRQEILEGNANAMLGARSKQVTLWQNPEQKPLENGVSLLLSTQEKNENDRVGISHIQNQV